MIHVLAVVAVLQQAAATYPTTPSGGDTTGYWQQTANYRITAQLDEARGLIAANGRLVYVNESPDTLREIYVHQHLNAFRPGSKWSEVDEREGRERFQRLRDPDFAYERFTAPVRALLPAGGVRDTVVLTQEYPGAPDSTVVRFPLPRPLAPGDTAVLLFQWEARPSTLPRRQARRGRSFDFAQWYPRVAVYDRLGWRANPLVPAGEFYGEFGTFDVTLVVPEDQVIGATGVPVSGDPGWSGAKRWGTLRPASDAYEVEVAPLDQAVPSGYKAVRFLARGVHHFGWSTSPDYRYEGGVYVRGAGAPTWNDARSAQGAPSAAPETVSVHVLYRPGDEETWGNGVVVERQVAALRWLEGVFGPYAYPQVTNLHRIEGGGTEFPMVTMNGSPSQGLILHETGHIYAHGLLANNEWASGWLDEGLSSYQSGWYFGETLPERGRAGKPTTVRGEGYRSLVERPTGAAAAQLAQIRLDLLGRAEPIGTRADQFNEFSIYNQMIYSRAERMYGALRDAMGDSAFAAFLHDYYDRWAFRHVDELAMRRAAERAHGGSLDWFFDQWVHRTGLIDYALGRVGRERAGAGWVTQAQVVKLGEYAHPMPVGVRTAGGWTIVRIAPSSGDTTVTIVTAERPQEVRLDPLLTTEDWDTRNNRPRATAFELLNPLTVLERAKWTIDWPFLDQYDRHREVAAVLPFAWYGDPGGATYALRVRTNYLGLVDRSEVGLAFSRRSPGDPDGFLDDGQLQLWAVVENPRRGSRVDIGDRYGAWLLDGVARLQWGRTNDESEYLFASGERRTSTVTVTATVPYELAYLPEQFARLNVFDAAWQRTVRGSEPGGFAVRGEVLGGFFTGPDASRDVAEDLFARVELEGTRSTYERGGRLGGLARLYLAATYQAPPQRSIGLSSEDATETFENHFYRPRGGLLKPDQLHFVPLGGLGLRAYSPFVRLTDAAALGATLEQGLRVWRMGAASDALSLWISGFADGAAITALGGNAEPDGLLGDVGVGVSLRGMLFDREITARLDLPILVSDPGLAIDATDGGATAERVRLRYVVSLGGF